MARTPVPIGFGHYQTDSAPFSSQRCVNWIPVAAEGGALNSRRLSQPPGLKQFADTAGGENRGSWVMAQVFYAVCGGSLFCIGSDGSVVTIGSISGTGRVSMADNGQYLVIVVPGGNAYAYDNVAKTLNQITDVDFRASDTVVYKDGYFVFSSSDGTVFFNSALNNPFAFDALDFGTAEINPDKVIALHVNHNELFVCGEETIELFQNVGGAGFPFQRIPSAYIQKGVYAKFSLVEFDNTFCFVGGGKNEKTAIWKVTGSSSAQKISTDAIDSEIQEYTRDEISNCFAMTMAFKGQFIALFTFESDVRPSRTFAYNATASQITGSSVWFEFQSGLNENRWRVNSIVAAHGKLLVGDQSSGIIGEIDSGTLDYYGDNIYRESTTMPFSQGGLPMFAGDFEATFEAGVGLIGGLDPNVQLEYSDNGGKTFKFKTTRKIGKIGEYGQRSVWQRQGRFPVSRSIRLIITDKVKATLIRLAATPELGVQ